jgi:hypothetical protein
MVNIQKIQKNLGILIQLNKDSLSPFSNEVAIVIINSLKSQDNKDNGLGLFGDVLFAAFSDIADTADLTNPVPAVVTAILSGLVNSYNTTPPQNLLKDFGRILDRLTNTNLQIDVDLSNIYSNVEANLDKTFTIPDGVLPSPFNTKKIIKISELEEYDLPNSDSSEYNKYLVSLTYGFRCGLTKQQLSLIGGYSVGGVYIKKMHAYWVFRAEAPPGGSGDVWEDGNYKINNLELQLQGRSVTVTGNSFDDFNKVAGDFCKQTGGLLVIINKTDTSIQYKKYYMLLDFTDGDEDFNWDLGADDFYNKFLFIDDGFGNVYNEDGVGKREDIYRNWGIQYGNQLPLSV